MPIYEYQCRSCGSRFERMQRISDPPPSSCDECGTEGEIKKLISAPAFQFKGDGWYVTDYARKDREKKNGSKPDETKSADAKDGGSKDGGSKDGGSKDGGSKDGSSKDGAKSSSGDTKGAASGSSS